MDDDNLEPFDFECSDDSIRGIKESSSAQKSVNDHQDQGTNRLNERIIQSPLHNELSMRQEQPTQIFNASISEEEKLGIDPNSNSKHSQ